MTATVTITHNGVQQASLPVTLAPPAAAYWEMRLPAVTAPTPNPLLRPTPFAQQDGAYWPNLNGYPAAIDALYPIGQLPAGIPAPPNAPNPSVMRCCTNDLDATVTSTQQPYLSHHAGYCSAGGTSPAILGPGHYSSAYISQTLCLDPSFPNEPTNDFQQLGELFGPPWTGSGYDSGNPTFFLGIEGPGFGVPPARQQQFYLQVAETPGVHPWTMPVERDPKSGLVVPHWLIFVWAFVFSTDPTVGGVRMWLSVDGQPYQPQQFTGSLPASVQRSADMLTLNYATLRDNTSPQSWYVDSYRTAPWAKQAITWHAHAAIGPTFTSVDPMLV